MGAGSAGVVVMNGREAGWSGLSGLSGCLVERARSLREQKIGTGVLPIWQLLSSPLLLYSKGWPDWSPTARVQRPRLQMVPPSSLSSL
jgi:hypothetical protein